jgi:hypothetical protein
MWDLAAAMDNARHGAGLLPCHHPMSTALQRLYANRQLLLCSHGQLYTRGAAAEFAMTIDLARVFSADDTDEDVRVNCENAFSPNKHAPNMIILPWMAWDWPFTLRWSL